MKLSFECITAVLPATEPAKPNVVEIAGREAESAVASRSKGVVIELVLPAGATELRTYLYGAECKAGGADFTEVEAL